MRRGIIICLILAAVLVMSMTACSSGSKTPESTAEKTTEASAETESKSAEEADVLSFLKAGEMYVELKLESSVKNAAVSVDGTKLSGSKTAYKKGAAFELSGDFAEDSSVNVIVVVDKGTSDSDRTSAEFKNGIDADRVSEYVTKVLARDNTQKIFISIFEKGGSWDKSLSEKMNEFIAGMFPVLK
ncbi:MAG: hypothetical protein IJM76_10900 [Lachnospiraceae bacterium]|nr:hypothetical protein [Lachnospiraceae bacterium]